MYVLLIAHPTGRVDTICLIHHPRNSLSYELVLVIRNLMGSQNKFSCVAKMATFGNSRNLHESKMAARTHLEN